MSRLQKLRERRAAVTDEMGTMRAMLEADDRLAYTEAEQTRYASLEKEAGVLDGDIDREERLDARIQTQAASAGRVTKPGANTAAATKPVITVKENFADDPMKGFKRPRDFIMAVMDAGQRGVVADERLKALATAGSDEQSTFSDSHGGFFVPEGMSPQVLQMEPEADPMGAFVTRVPMNTTSVTFNARVDKNHSSSVSGGLTVTRRAEAADASSSRAQYEKVKLEAFSLFGLAYATEELLTDSPISFAAILSQGFADEFASAIINERLNGTGVGEFMGIMNSPCLLSIAKETGQAAATIVYDNLIKMRARCWRYANAIWLANQDTLPQLAKLNIAVGTGGSIVWAPSAREDVPDVLLGRPLVFTEYCKTVGTTGDIVLGNWSQYLEGVYQPMQSAESIHVRFISHERTFKFWMRDAGAPWWKSALTPKNGATLSPFVKLDARA